MPMGMSEIALCRKIQPNITPLTLVEQLAHEFGEAALAGEVEECPPTLTEQGISCLYLM